jgi:hypothetical protein
LSSGVQIGWIRRNTILLDIVRVCCFIKKNQFIVVRDELILNP